jgi:hypothetical protein
MTTNPWSVEEAWNWYRGQGWPCGFNYIPANAISYTEMWMAECFDPALIAGELKLAQDVGFNCLRVVLPFVVWEREPDTFKSRFAGFLEICHRRSIRVMPALFDDCAFGPMADPVFGPQPKVIPGWYGNGWTPSPGHAIVREPKAWPRLEPYVKDILGTFRDDPRVWVWDLYNEPTNGVAIGKLYLPLGDISLALVEKVFAWARQIGPPQPLTVGAWNDNAKLNELCLAHSDINTFHHYGPPEALEKRIQQIKRGGRPVICTEWLNRGTGSTVAACLPIFTREGVGALHWGLVNGKTQTHLGWGHLPGEPEPQLWQHDLFRADHTAYDAAELACFKAAIKRTSAT